MSIIDSDDWQKMLGAPRDGSRILVAVRASEQGPAEVDIVRWATPAHAAEKGWIAADSQPDFPVVYSEGELSGWMPVPTPAPNPARSRGPGGAPKKTGGGEMDGSSI